MVIQSNSGAFKNGINLWEDEVRLLIKLNEINSSQKNLLINSSDIEGMPYFKISSGLDKLSQKKVVFSHDISKYTLNISDLNKSQYFI